MADGARMMLALPGIPDASCTVGWRPLVPVAVTARSTDRAAFTGALVDSGADVTFIPRATADYLGLPPEHGERVEGTLGGVQTHGYRLPVPVEVNLAGFLVALPAAIVAVECDALLLGRDVFDSFVVTFDQRAQEVRFEPYEGVAFNALARMHYADEIMMLGATLQGPWDFERLARLEGELGDEPGTNP